MPHELTERSTYGRYVAAFIGTHCAFLPLLTFLLPSAVEKVSDRPIIDLSLLLIAGAITASIANIVAGRLSDTLVEKRGTRRSMAVAGLAATVASLSAFALATSLGALLAALLAFQLSLNLLFVPLVAVLADHVPDHRKGLTAAWLNFALPIGTLASSATAWAIAPLGILVYPALGAIVASLVIPFLSRWPGRTSRRSVPTKADAEIGTGTMWRDFVLAWLARLFIQFGAAVTLSYLYLYIAQYADGADSARTRLSQLTLWSVPVALVAGLYVGRASDRISRRRPAIVVSSSACAIALALLVLAPGWWAIAVGFGLFITSLTIFLALDSAMVAELLKHSSRRGWALGWMNLTNTLPAVAAPALTIGFAVSISNPDVIRMSLAVSTVLALASAVLVSAIRSVR